MPSASTHPAQPLRPEPAAAPAAAPAVAVSSAPAAERGSWVPLWALFSFVAALGVHLSASYTTAVSIELMRSVSPFADEVRKQDLALLPYYRANGILAAVDGMAEIEDVSSAVSKTIDALTG